MPLCGLLPGEILASLRTNSAWFQRIQLGMTRAARFRVSPSEILKRRTADFALEVVKFCAVLPQTWEARRLGGQLFDAGTSVGANYRAACRSRSKREFISKIGLVIEEADESEYWLMLAKRAGMIRNGTTTVDRLSDEAGQLVAIFTASQKTATANLEKEKLARRKEMRASNR